MAASRRALKVQVVMDNYWMHKKPLIRAWFAKSPRFHAHFNPIYGSWLNLVDWFEQLRGLAHCSALETAIYDIIEVHNTTGKPLLAKMVNEILAIIARFAQPTLTLQSGR